MDATGDVVFALSDGVLLLDVAGPVQVFDSAGGYRVRLASVDGRAVRTDVGVSLGVDLALSEVGGDVDTLVVPGYPRDEFAGVVPELVDGVRRLAAGARRVVSVCTGGVRPGAGGVARRAAGHDALAGLCGVGGVVSRGASGA
ncbi:hypothetical protein GCM10020001_035350 [Nonomuraea salmonea]